MLLLMSFSGNGLLLSSGKVWARNRRLLTGAFHFDVLRHYIRVYTETGNVLLVSGTVKTQFFLIIITFCVGIARKKI